MLQLTASEAEFLRSQTVILKMGRGKHRKYRHFKEAQRLNPESWNYKRQAWALSDARRDYGTTFGDQVKKLDGKPYYAPRQLPAKKTDGGKDDDRN